jgi:hypothetical protein
MLNRFFTFSSLVEIRAQSCGTDRLRQISHESRQWQERHRLRCCRESNSVRKRLSTSLAILVFVLVVRRVLRRKSEETGRKSRCSSCRHAGCSARAICSHAQEPSYWSRPGRRHFLHSFKVISTASAPFTLTHPLIRAITRRAR